MKKEQSIKKLLLLGLINIGLVSYQIHPSDNNNFTDLPLSRDGTNIKNSTPPSLPGENLMLAVGIGAPVAASFYAAKKYFWDSKGGIREYLSQPLNFFMEFSKIAIPTSIFPVIIYFLGKKYKNENIIDDKLIKSVQAVLIPILSKSAEFFIQARMNVLSTQLQEEGLANLAIEKIKKENTQIVSNTYEQLSEDLKDPLNFNMVVRQIISLLSESTHGVKGAVIDGDSGTGKSRLSKRMSSLCEFMQEFATFVKSNPQMEGEDPFSHDCYMRNLPAFLNFKGNNTIITKTIIDLPSSIFKQPYVGQGEKYVRTITDYLKEQGHFIVLSEADTCFPNRKKVREGAGGGEKSLTNTWLRALETLWQKTDESNSEPIPLEKRICIFGSTNLPEDVDPALFENSDRMFCRSLYLQSDESIIARLSNKTAPVPAQGSESYFSHIKKFFKRRNQNVHLIPPDKSLYTILEEKGAFASGEGNRIVSLLAALFFRGIKPDDLTYRSIADLLPEKSGHLQLLPLLFGTQYLSYSHPTEDSRGVLKFIIKENQLPAYLKCPKKENFTSDDDFLAERNKYPKETGYSPCGLPLIINNKRQLRLSIIEINKNLYENPEWSSNYIKKTFGTDPVNKNIQGIGGNLCRAFYNDPDKISSFLNHLENLNKMLLKNKEEGYDFDRNSNYALEQRFLDYLFNPSTDRNFYGEGYSFKDATEENLKKIAVSLFPDSSDLIKNFFVMELENAVKEWNKKVKQNTNISETDAKSYFGLFLNNFLLKSKETLEKEAPTKTLLNKIMNNYFSETTFLFENATNENLMRIADFVLPDTQKNTREYFANAFKENIREWNTEVGSKISSGKFTTLEIQGLATAHFALFLNNYLVNNADGIKASKENFLKKNPKEMEIMAEKPYLSTSDLKQLQIEYSDSPELFIFLLTHKRYLASIEKAELVPSPDNKSVTLEVKYIEAKNPNDDSSKKEAENLITEKEKMLDGFISNVFTPFILKMYGSERFQEILKEKNLDIKGFIDKSKEQLPNKKLKDFIAESKKSYFGNEPTAPEKRYALTSDYSYYNHLRKILEPSIIKSRLFNKQLDPLLKLKKSAIAHINNLIKGPVYNKAKAKGKKIIDIFKEKMQSYKNNNQMKIIDRNRAKEQYKNTILPGPRNF